MALWTPAEITTALWLDASDSSTITIATGVSNWADKSGNSRDQANAAGVNQPVVTSAAHNGLDVITYSGGAKYLTGGFPNITDYSMFVVYKRTNSPTNAYGNIAFVTSIGTGSSATASRLADIYYDNTTGFNWPPKAGSSVLSYTRDDLLNVHSCIGRIGSGTSEYYLNGGGTQTLNTSGLSGAAGTLLLRTGLNSWSTIDPFYFVGDLAEIVVVGGALSTGDRQLVEGYLAWKWGREASLPAGHPYESAAPTTGSGADLLGAASVIATAAGAISSSMSLAGAAASISTAAGAALMTITLPASQASASATATADLSDGNDNSLSGAAAAVATASASLGMSFTLSGASVAAALASAHLMRADDVLSGDAAIASTATATLASGMTISGAADVVVLAGGNMIMTVNFSGDAAAQAQAQAVISLIVPMDGAALSQSLASALLFVGDAWSGLTLEAYTLRAPERNYTLTSIAA